MKDPITESSDLKRPQGDRLRYTLVLLVLVSFISYVDRQILAVLLQPVRADLHLSDTDMGLLTGAFFSLTFMVAGIPLARLADTSDRRSIIALCMTAWSIATAACGLVHSFAQLATARVAVALGEAGSAPASYSLLSDLFPERRRALVFAMLSAGSALGLAFGVFCAGGLNDLVGWRMTFLIVAMPGIMLALLLRFTAPEPPRSDGFASERPSLPHVFGELLRLTTFRWLVVVTIAASCTTFAMLGWMPTFLMRVHGMTHSALGVRMGGAIALGLLFGNIAAGMLADALRTRDHRWLIWIAGTGLALCVPTGMLTLYASSPNGSIVFLTCYMFFMGSWSPLLATIAVGLVGNHGRATAASTIPILQGLGGAIGPFVVGALNDHWAASLGAASVRLSLAVSLGGCVIAAIAALLAAPALRREYRAAPIAGRH